MTGAGLSKQEAAAAIRRGSSLPPAKIARLGRDAGLSNERVYGLVQGAVLPATPRDLAFATAVAKAVKTGAANDAAVAPAAVPVQAPAVRVEAVRSAPDHDKAVQPDRDEMARFVEEVFRYVPAGGRVAARTFLDGVRDAPPVDYDEIPWRGDAGRLVDRLWPMVERAAAMKQSAVFAPPLCIFREPDRATYRAGDWLPASEAEIQYDVAAVVELDRYPVAALATLRDLVGEPSLIVSSGGEWVDPETGEIEAKAHAYYCWADPTQGGADGWRAGRRARDILSKLVPDAADRSAVSPVHPLRWAGGVHRKRGPGREVVTRIVAQSGVYYDRAEFVAKLERLAAERGVEVHDASDHGDATPERLRAADPADVAAALALIPNDDAAWNRWNHIGMATWAATGGSPEGYEAFSTWSSKSAKHDPEATRSRWAHFSTSPPTKLGFGTLVHEARRVDPSWSPAGKPGTAVGADFFEDKPAPASEGGDGKAAPDARPFADWTRGLTVPTGFAVKASGVYRQDVDKTTGEVSERALTGPLRILGETATDDGTGAGLLLEFTGAAARAHRVVVDRRELIGEGDAVLRELADRGLQVPRSGRDKQSFLDFLHRVRHASRIVREAAPGWSGAAFAVPGQTFGWRADGGLPLVLAGDRTAFARAGDLASWNREVGALAAGQSRLTLAILLGLAGPLLRWADPAAAGGVHFNGSSSSGKSIALRLAASVIGPPRVQVRSWASTIAGLEDVAAGANNLTLLLDELGQADARRAAESVYLVSNGTGKTRSDRGLQARAVKRWSLLLLSSGEVGLAGHAASAGETTAAGQELRLVDVAADAGAGLGILDHHRGFPTAAALAEAIDRAVRLHHGTLLPAFLERLTAADADEVGRVVRADVARLLELAGVLPGEATGQARRVAARFALALSAGRLAARWELLPWLDEGGVEQAVVTCYRAWLASWGSSGVDREVMKLLGRLRRFLELHGESRFRGWGKAEAPDLGDDGVDAISVDGRAAVAQRAGWRRVEGERVVYHMLPGCFAAEVAAPMTEIAAARALVRNGVLLKGSTDELRTKIRTPGGEKPRVYRLVMPSD